MKKKSLYVIRNNNEFNCLLPEEKIVNVNESNRGKVVFDVTTAVKLIPVT